MFTVLTYLLTAGLLYIPAHAAAGAAGAVKTIYKDVAIIGGGASGSYSAVRLREDFGVSIVVIEKDVTLVCPSSRLVV